MSRESSDWLNQNVLIGYTEKRGHAWHYRASSQGDEPNHYPGAIPVDDVLRRLFHWEAQAVPMFHQIPVEDVQQADGVDVEGHPFRWQQVEGSTLWRRSDTYAKLGTPSETWAGHQYREWLVKTLADIIDTDTTDLGIASAGLLKGGRVAWMQIELPDSITTPEGVEFRPFLMGSTAFDQSLATRFDRGITNVVCDNTMHAAHTEHGALSFKIRHSKYSGFKLQSVRSALEIVHTAADDFAAEVKALCEMKVTDKQWESFLDAHVPLPEIDPNKPRGSHGHTLATTKRDALSDLWKGNDERVANWRNTGWGVLQAVNTYEHHLAIVRGRGEIKDPNALRAERNMERAVKGDIAKLDMTTLETLTDVLANA